MSPMYSLFVANHNMKLRMLSLWEVLVSVSKLLPVREKLQREDYRKDREKCILIADKLKSTLVINGDGRDLALLREEGIKNTDAFISVTHSSETNILSCLLAKKVGVKRAWLKSRI